MKSFKLYIFDLDNTLYDEKDFLAQAYHNIANAIEKKTSIHRHLIEDFLSDTFQKNGRKNIFDACITHFRLSSIVTVQALQEILYSTAATAHLQLFPWVKDYFQKLFREQKKISILTNGNITQQKNKVRSLGLQKLNSNIMFYYATQDNQPKPSPYWVMKILETTQLEKSDVLIIGDCETDALCAKNADISFMNQKKFCTTLPD